MQINSDKRGSQTLGIVLIGLGILFLGGQVFHINAFGIFSHIAWPLYVVIPGIAVLALGLISGKSGVPVTIMGSIATATGLILAYQDTFNQYQTWAYAWTLYPVAVGAALVLHGSLHAQPGVVQRGSRVLGIGAVLFVVFWTFFEMFIGLSGNSYSAIGRMLGPVVLIAVGLYVFFRQNQPKVKR